MNGKRRITSKDRCHHVKPKPTIIFFKFGIVFGFKLPACCYFYVGIGLFFVDYYSQDISYFIASIPLIIKLEENMQTTDRKKGSSQTSDRIKLTVYLPDPLIRNLKIQAAQLGLMSYSGITETNIKRILKELEDLKDFTELSRSPKYMDRLKNFLPVKRGRPPAGRKVIIKKKITFYISPTFFKIVRKNQRHFNLSESSLIEMALLLSSKL